MLVAVLMAPAAAAQSCEAYSGEYTAALVELYTSEGCSSCPPADRWLSSLGMRGYVPARVVPLALHVDYWDYIGWKDPYARQALSGRQRKLTQLQRLAFVYTPQVMLQGRDFRAWRSAAAFDEAIGRINRERARARIFIGIDSIRTDRIEARVSASLLDRAHLKDAALYVAAFENKLGSRVTAGENSGKTLEHDFVVLEWQGPFAFSSDGKRADRRTLPLLPKAVPAHSGVAAFVQNRRSLEVLQALMLPACET